MSEPTHKYHGRFFSPQENPDPESSEFKALLEASLKDFDAAAALHVDAPQRAKPASEATLAGGASSPEAFPTLAPADQIAAPRTRPTETTFASPLVTDAPKPSGGGLDLLSELRQTAHSQATREQDAATARKIRVDQADQAMRLLFRYLVELTGHLNQIRPLVPRQFRPLPNIELCDLHWTESFVDYRTDGGTEVSPFESVSLRYTISAGNSILAQKLPNYAGDYHDELKRVGLRYTASEQRGTRGLVEQINFQVAREVTVSLFFRADVDTGQVELRARNFTELNTEFYTMPLAALDPAWLDELGKHVLGRRNCLFSTLKPR